MRPPSPEPSTPDVNEPRRWGIPRRLGYRLPYLQRRQDRLDGRLVAQPAGVQDHVVVGGVVAVMAVYLPDVGSPVLVGLLQALPGLLFGDDVEALHDGLDPDRLGRPEEDVERAGEVG